MKVTHQTDDAKGPARPALPDPIELRPLVTEAELAACVRMQREIWGDGYGELVPPVILKIVQKVGGVAAGAFDAAGRMLGFVFGITGVEHGRLVHWSHMLAVQPELRDSGLGRRLKEYQRAQIAPLGVELIYWTFDPMVARNAHLNLNRLGAEVVEYVLDMYGQSTSALHTLGTDRLVVAWRVAESGREQVAQTTRPEAISDMPRPAGAPGPSKPPIVNLNEAGAPVAASTSFPIEPEVRIAIPAELDRVLRESPELARRWQQSVQRSFLHYLGAGYRVTGFDRAETGGQCYYILLDVTTVATPTAVSN